MLWATDCGKPPPGDPLSSFKDRRTLELKDSCQLSVIETFSVSALDSSGFFTARLGTQAQLSVFLTQAQGRTVMEQLARRLGLKTDPTIFFVSAGIMVVFLVALLIAP